MGHALYDRKRGSNVDIKSLFFAPDPNRRLGAMRCACMPAGGNPAINVLL